MQSERERLCMELGAREIFIDTSRAECLERLAADKSRDKDEWTKYIEDWWQKFSRDVDARLAE